MIRLLDYSERLFVALLCIPFVIAFAQSFKLHPQFVLVAMSELMVVILIMIRKPGDIAATPYAFLIAIVGTALPLLVRPTGGISLVPDWLGWLPTALMFTGLLINISAKLFLNRSFGIVAANRGVKRGGPYRLVRHPMYLGYMTTQLGFLLASFSLANVALYGTTWFVQILRIREEEKFLLKDEAYAAYSRSVTYRLIPGIF